MAQLQKLVVDTRTDDDLPSLHQKKDELALSIKRKLSKVPYQSTTTTTTTTERSVTIFRVPSHIRKRNKNFYEPRWVSIGPYHWRCEDLNCMEDQKLRFLHKMLHENPDVTLNDYVEALRKLEPTARRCYHETTKLNSDEFVEMLLYDACFIIQLIVLWHFREDDIVFNTTWNVPLIKSDLLMLENQIPYFVLQCVFDIYSSIDEDTSDLISPSSDESGGTDFDEASLGEDSEPEKATLSYLLAYFLQHGSEKFKVPEGEKNYDHLLDFYYQCYMLTQELPTKPMKKCHLLEILGSIKVSPLITSIKVSPLISSIKVSPLISSIKRLTMRRRADMIITHRKPRMIPCATELQEAGVTFKKAKTASIFGVHFSNGVLMIPYTSVEEARRPQIMNLIAFEQCSGQKNKILTSYAVFMDCIVNTPRDVLILQKNGIIENKLANEKSAAEFFNQLRYLTYPNYEEHHLAELFQDVKRYCDSSWQKHRAKLHRDYFSNPWAIISFIAAIVLLLLTFVQTLYTVMSYYH